MKQNLVSGQGETFALHLDYEDNTGNPVDLAGHTILFRLMKANVGTVITQVNAAVDNVGNVDIKVTDEVTDTWPVGKNAYVVVHVQPNGDERWLLNGALTVVGESSV